MAVYYISPFNSQYKLGGMRVLYRQVDILNRNGIETYMTHGVPRFRCTWFENSTRIAYPPITVTDADVLAFPEISSVLLNRVAPGIPKVSINQGAYLSLTASSTADHPYNCCRDLRGVTAVSDQNLEMLRYAFPATPVTRIRVSVDPELFYPTEGPRVRRIIYMPRRRRKEADQVIALLQLRGALKGWSVDALDGLPHARVAEEMRRSALFLSFSQQEGFGLPPLEALACGCSVIGFSGFGGDDYFGGDECLSVPDGDVLAFARKVEQWISSYDERRPWESACERAQRYLSEYSPEREAADIIRFWQEILGALPTPSGTTWRLRPEDTWIRRPAAKWRVAASRAKGSLKRRNIGSR